jgi:integrase
MSLAAARAEAQAAIADLENNVNPAITKANEDAAVKREQEVKQIQQGSVGEAAEEFIKRGLKKKEKERGETERIIRKEILGEWKQRGIADIRKPDVLNLLDAIVDRGASVMACRTRSVMLRFFKWSAGRGYIEESPMLGVAKPGEDHEDRERVLDPSELAEVWTAAGTLGYPFGPFVQLLILTAQRRGEVATMQWKDVQLDRALWVLPKPKTKTSRSHEVPLSAAALTLLGELPRFTKGDFIFTTTSGEKPVNGFSKIKERIDRRTSKPIEDWVMHDLRRTAATLMAKAGVQPHVLTKILNHTAPASKLASPILKIYNRYEYLEEKRHALEAWAQYVANLIEGKTAAKEIAS